LGADGSSSRRHREEHTEIVPAAYDNDTHASRKPRFLRSLTPIERLSALIELGTISIGTETLASFLMGRNLSGKQIKFKAQA
jgi:hypothetical protein